jgi:hypothetical protein
MAQDLHGNIPRISFILGHSGTFRVHQLESHGQAMLLHTLKRVKVDLLMRRAMTLHHQILD